MADALPIATVVAVIGKAYARDAEGNLRTLKPGDVLLEGDTVVTAAGDRVELALGNGEPLFVLPNQTVQMTAELSDSARPSVSESAVAGADIDRVIQALERGGDLDAELDAPAAGLDGGAGGDGNSFVRLLRIAEGVEPLAFEFAAAQRGIEFPFGGLNSDEQASTAQASATAIARDDSLAATEDTPLSGSLATNDTPSTDGGNVWAVATGPSHGTVTVNPDGSFTYTPDADFSGPDSFTYTITDADGDVSTATASINVAPVDDVPVARNDTATTAEDAPVTIDVLGNDSDPDGDTLTITAVAGQPISVGSPVTILEGLVALNVDGTLTFTPNANFNGPVSFEYTVSDGTTPVSATVDITVAAVDDMPVAVDDTLAAVEDTELLGNLASNDTPSGDGGNVWALAAGPANGTVIVNTDGTFSYTPNANYNGADSFTYTITDADGDVSTATASITVAAVDDMPVAVDDTLAAVEDTELLGNLASNDTPSGDGGNVWALAAGPANGTVIVNTDGTFSYTPNANYNGADSFTYTITDADGDVSTATASITVAAVDDGPPVAADDAFVTTVSTPIIITAGQLLANDTLRDHAQISSVGPVVGGGTLLNNNNGTWTYTPPATTGTRTFSYTLTDDDGQTSTATVNLTVLGARDDLATVHESALPNGTGGGTTVATGNLFANDGGGTSITNINGVTDGSAGDSDARAGYIGITTSIGKLVVDSSGAGAGDYTYTLLGPADNSAPGNNLGVTEVFNYTSANNGTPNFTTAALRVNVVDDAPLAFDRVVKVSEDAAPSYNLVLVLDVSGSMDIAAAGGAVRQLNADGSITITTRLQMAKDAMKELVSEYYNQAQNVSVTLITFSSSATIINSGVPYANKAATLSAIDGLDGSGGTNYESALSAVQTAFGTINPALKNTLYFISDGEPSVGNTTDPAGASGYTTWIANNPVNAYAVGIGTGIANTGPLNSIHNVDADGSGMSDGAIIVPDLNDLDSALLSTVPTAYGGNLVSNANVGNVLGADGGYVQTIEIMLDSNNDGIPDQLVTFTYNSVSNQVSQNSSFLTGFPSSGDLVTLSGGQGFRMGTLTFNFKTGEYTFFTDGSAVEGDRFDLRFVARDNDGDVTPPTLLRIEVADGQPVARPDSDTLLANQTHFEGNVISGLGTDGGLPQGQQVASFSAAGSGVDKAVDGAQVTAVSFKGVSYDLTTNASGSGSGFTWSVSNGSLSWNAGSGGSSLVFNKTGFYKYVPPTADVPVTTASAAVTTLFNTSGNATANGVLLSGFSRTGTAQTLSYQNPSGTASDGVGVNGGSSGSVLDNLETLLVKFNQASHPNGVQSVRFVVAPDASNLGSASGTVRALTYVMYDVAGELLGRFYSDSEGLVTLPTGYSNIGSIEIEANSAASARLTSVTFESVQANNSAAAVAPVEIGYTLTDNDGDTSSSVLTTHIISNSVFGDDGNNTLAGTAGNDRMIGGAGNDTLNGGAGHDILEGGAGDDILNGGDGNDILRGGAGNDTLNGGAGNDLLSGGAGNDVLTGGLGADVFQWSLSARGPLGSPASDRITDFDISPTAAGGDAIDLRDLLQGEQHVGSDVGSLLNYLHFEQNGGSTVVHVSSNGGFSAGYSAGKEDVTITLDGVNLFSGGLTSDQQVIQDLLAKGKLISD